MWIEFWVPRASFDICWLIAVRALGAQWLLIVMMGWGLFLPCSIYVPILWSAVSCVSVLHPLTLLQFAGFSFLLAKGFLPGFLYFVTKGVIIDYVRHHVKHCGNWR